jgi:hypothetical protein
MSSSNLPDPDKIPDMSLGERSDKAPAPIPPWEVPTSIQAQAGGGVAPPEKSEPPARVWRAGDRVLAPWEPMFLYAGTIEQIKVDDARGDQALIDFDDGGAGWVFVYSICPREITTGQRVHCRRGNGPQYYPCEILDVDGDDVRVHFDEGGVEWTTVATLRFPCIENGPPAVPTRFAPWQKPPSTSGTGMPSWAITAIIVVALLFLRLGCRAVFSQ